MQIDPTTCVVMYFLYLLCFQAIAVQVCASVLSAFWAGIGSEIGTGRASTAKRPAAPSVLPGSTHAASSGLDAHAAPTPSALGCCSEGDSELGRNAETLGGLLLSVLTNPVGSRKVGGPSGGGNGERNVVSHGPGGGGDAGNPQEAWLCALPSLNPLAAAALLSAGRSLRRIVTAVCQVGPQCVCGRIMA